MFKWWKILNFGYLGRFQQSLLTFKRSHFSHFGARGLFFASGHISIIFLSYDCKHLILVSKSKEKLVEFKITENKCPFWSSILVFHFNENLNFSAHCYSNTKSWFKLYSKLIAFKACCQAQPHFSFSFLFFLNLKLFEEIKIFKLPLQYFSEAEIFWWLYIYYWNGTI